MPIGDKLVVQSFRADRNIETGYHGFACAEIVHNIAPDVTLYLVNYNTKHELAQSPIDETIALSAGVGSYIVVGLSWNDWGLNWPNEAGSRPLACTDRDNDGYNVRGDTCGTIDCDDSNAAVNPEATEGCIGIDDNCNSQTDEGCNVCTDVDGDGWCVESGDCDDNNRQVYPGHIDSKGRWSRSGLDNDSNGIIDG